MIKSAILGLGRAFDRPELWLVRSVLLAAIIAVVYYSGDKAKDAPTQAILIFLGLAAVGFHFVGAKKACAAWYSRCLGSLLAWVLVIAGAVAWEVNSQMGISSANQDNLSMLQRTAAVVTQTNDDEVNRLAASLMAKQGEAAWRTDTGPVGVVQARIDTMRAHKWWASTNQCAEPKGPQTRDYCAAYRQAEADKAMAVRRATLAEEIKAVERELAAARSKRSAAPQVASVERADLRNLKRLTGLSSADLELSQSLLVVLVMALFLTVAGWLIKAEEFEGRTLRPWINWGGAIARLRRAWDGTDTMQTSYAMPPERGAMRIAGTTFAQMKAGLA
jgi:hypothetical protein